MAYDKELDKTIWEKAKQTGDQELIVGIYSYNDGEKKIGFRRKFLTTRGDWDSGFRRIGRLTLEEAKTINDIFQEAINELQES